MLGYRHFCERLHDFVVDDDEYETLFLMLNNTSEMIHNEFGEYL